MKTNRFPIFFLILASLLACSGLGESAPQIQALTLAHALQLAFEHDPHFALFLREQQLQLQQNRSDRPPTVAVTASPGEIQDGSWQKPKAALSLNIPLGSAWELAGTLSLERDQNGWEAVPRGNLSLNYDFLAWEEPVFEKTSPEENMLREQNKLVLKILDLLVGLENKLAFQSYLQGKSKHLQKAWQVGSVTPGFAEFKLKKEIRELAKQLADLKDELDLLQLELAFLLGAAADVVYRPLLQVKPYQFAGGYDLYSQELFAFNQSLKTARAELQALQARLAHEKKYGGWELRASGQITLQATWNVGLRAHKTLYPRGIFLEELELAVAKGLAALREKEVALEIQLKADLKAVQSALAQIEFQKEHLEAAREDWELVRRQLKAGLATEFTLQEAKLQLQQVELEYRAAQFQFVQNVLRLYAQCGRNLAEEVQALIN